MLYKSSGINTKIDWNKVQGPNTSVFKVQRPKPKLIESLRTKTTDFKVHGPKPKLTKLQRYLSKLTENLSTQITIQDQNKN